MLISYIFLRVQAQDQLVLTEMTVLQFQDQIRRQIKSHADKIAAHQLGSSVLVEEDVVIAMSNVWTALPQRTQDAF